MRSKQTRKLIRLENFDYTEHRSYFITICTHKKFELFGEVKNNVMLLSNYGEIVEFEIKRQEEVYPEIYIARHIVMPNHIHMIVKIQDAKRSIPKVIQQFKGIVSKRIGFSPWQRNFHDRIIRNENEYIRIEAYIKENVSKWDEDCFHPKKSNNP